MWLWRRTPSTWAPPTICPLETTFNQEPLSETLEVWHVRKSIYVALLLIFLTFVIFVVHLIDGFRELHGAICSDSLFGLGQRRHEHRLRHQLPSVTLLDSLTPLPSLLNESLYSDQPAFCVRTRQQNFDEMIFLKLWYSERSSQPTITANIIWRKKKM